MSMRYLNATQEENAIKMVTYEEFDKLLQYMNNCEIETTEEIDAINNVLKILGLEKAFYNYVVYKKQKKER